MTQGRAPALRADPIRIRVPGDKSVTHRALILAALTRGRSIVRNPLVALDTRSTAGCLNALGARIPELGGPELIIESTGRLGLRAPATLLDCGNSGTTARLLLGVLSGCPFTSVLTGDASLRSRPMRRVTQPLGAAGATFEELGEPDRLPIAVTGGALNPIDHDSVQASAQVKSALLLAALTAGVTARVSEPHRSRDHTERMLSALGAPIRVHTEHARNVVTLEPVDALRTLDLTVPGDFSSAAFFLAYGLLSTSPVTVVGAGINPTRTGFLDIVRRMGGEFAQSNVRDEGGEPVADLTAFPAELRGGEIGGEDVVRAIDEVPIIAILAARATGETRITGAAELRFKESDRLAALAENLRAVGVNAEELPDGLAIAGTPAPLRGRVRTHGDHRIAMAFGVLAALPGNDIVIDDPAAAAVSFPQFWQQLDACRAAR